MTTATTKTRTIAGHKFTLTHGRRYVASRPMAERGVTRFTVSVTDITDGFAAGSFAIRSTATVEGLSYDAANALLTKFNNGSSSWEGREW